MTDASRGATGPDSDTAPGAAASPRRVIVAGDIAMDWNLARTRRLVDSGATWNADDRTEVYGKLGGAALVAGLMTEVAATLAAGGLAVEVSGPSVAAGPIAPDDPRFNHSFAIWAKYPKKKGDRDRSIWRVEDFLGLDRAPKPEATTAATGPADLVIIDDADLGFRDSPASWPEILGLADNAATAAAPAQAALTSPSDAPRPWVLLKMSCPVASGELWRRLIRRHAGRLVVVLTLNDLRLSEVKISRSCCPGTIPPTAARTAWTSPSAAPSSTPSRSRTAGPSNTPAR